MFFISNKKPQLIFLCSILACFSIFLFTLIKSDEPAASKKIPVVTPVEQTTPVVEETENVQETLFKLSLSEDENYISFSSKANELGASISYFDKVKKVAVLSVDGKHNSNEWLVHLKRKYINSVIEPIDSISLENQKKYVFVPTENSATFYSPERDLIFSTPLSWTSVEEGDLYTFFDASGQTVMSVSKISKSSNKTDEVIQTHLQSSLEKNFSLDGDIEKIDKENGIFTHQWTLTNNDIFIPQGAIETTDSIYLFDSKQNASFDDFMLVFGSALAFD